MVFSTRERRPWLDEAIVPRLFDYLGGAIRQEGGILLQIGSIADHVHLFARLRQDRTLADVLRNIKSSSSNWLHREFAALDEFAWQEGYGAFTVSESQVGKVAAYVASQELHHRKQSFEEEFIALLKAHNVPYNERYIWH